MVPPIGFLIVVPTLDSYRLLPRLLTSLKNQSFPFWRLLFIDGPSRPEHRLWLDACCAREPRCQWVPQVPEESGMFGAMNQGFAAAADARCFAEGLLFWGSDDWAASSNVLAEIWNLLECEMSRPDLLVCGGRYFELSTGRFGRSTIFQPPSLLTATAYRRALLLGSTPPHQATLFGPGARQRLASYASGFRLSADLDYFLQLSRYSGLRVQCLDLELVHMADGGVSGQQTQRRLQEVRRAYLRAFGWLWWFPFLMRYLRRVVSLLDRSR